MIDRHVIMTVVIIIGIIALVLVAGIVHAAAYSRQIDAGVSALAGSSIGYLGGLLTNITRGNQPVPAPLPSPVEPPPKGDGAAAIPTQP